MCAFFGRGKNKLQDLHTLKGSYEFYMNNVKDSSLYKVSLKTYKAIIEEYYSRVMHDVVYNGRLYKFPFRLGKLYIVKRKVNLNRLNKYGINWPETVKADKYVYHLNTHSSGYVYRFKWEKETTLVPNLYFYKFVPTRLWKRTLAKIILNKQCDYFEK